LILHFRDYSGGNILVNILNDKQLQFSLIDTARIQAIIDRLLDLAKLEQQSVLENPKELSIKKLLDKVVRSKQAVMETKKITCQCIVSEEAVLYGDAFLLQQVVSNLLDNAIDFSPAKGNIFIKEAQRDGYYELAISDEGPGIPDFAKGKIFDRFYSLARPDTGKKSSGLGLNFVKEVMALHRGKVQIESSSKGTIIQLIFKH